MGRKAHLEDKLARDIVMRSATLIYDALSETSKLPYQEKIELSKHFVLKAMPSKIEADGIIGNQIVYLIRNERAITESEENTQTPLLSG